jgi:hypothetical protein
MTQEGLHSIHTKNQKPSIYKVDLSKDFNRASWLYFQLKLIHLGFFHPFVTWIMNYINSTSFSMLINGSTSPFSNVERGLR